MKIRTATPDETPAVRNVVDGAVLELEAQALDDAIENDDVFVAVRESDGTGSALVLGALVLAEGEILAVAVRNRRRDQGIGTALVESAAEHHNRLHAEFHERVRPFWESLDFSVEPASEADRFCGRRWR